jgi:hypothetical protein
VPIAELVLALDVLELGLVVLDELVQAATASTAAAPRM